MATETGSREPSAAQLSKTQVFDAIKNLRRRYALYYLMRTEGPVKLGSLAEQVAAWENDTTVDQVTPEQRKSVYSALYQTHLPKLEEAGVLTYDRESNDVTFTDRAKHLDLYLASDSRTTVRWQRLYLGLGLGAVLAVTLCGLGVNPFAAIPGIAWAGIVSITLVVIALAHTYDRRQWRERFDGAAPDFALEFGEGR